MVHIAHGNIEAQRKFHSQDYAYEYPRGLDLKPGSELHDSLLVKILERAHSASGQLSTRFDSWREMDKFLTAYKYTDDDEDAVKDDDPRKPVSIVFPYSYAILETLLSYMMAAFFRDPIFRYEGYSPDDVLGAIMLEQVVQLHCNKFRVMLNLHTMFRDAFSYGIGVVAPVWKRERRGFAGNGLENIDPYRYLPDPNVSADDIQSGEFVGWVNTTNYLNLLAEEGERSEVFNVKYLSGLGNRHTSVFASDSSGRSLKTGHDRDSTLLDGLVDEIFMYVNLVPQDWGLGDGDRPEKWLFRVAGDSVILEARPAGFEHEKFPIAVICPDFDGYSPTPLSRLEILGGLQGVLDWLFNSHIANVRKAINDMIIYDPYLVNSADLEDPKPGKLIRMRRPGWGKGVGDAVQQLKVADITQANVADSTWIVQWMQKIGATDDAAMGALRAGGPERLTKAEFQGTQGGAVSRLERIAKVAGLQGMSDIGEFFAEHTLQLMEDDAYVRVAGEWEQVLLAEYGESIDRGRLAVRPKDLDVNYDLVVRDGSIPGGNYSDVWLRMFDILAQHPELGQKFDLVRIFKHIARNSGAKNVNSFVRRGGSIDAQPMGNEALAGMMQSGQVSPLEGF